MLYMCVKLWPITSLFLYLAEPISMHTHLCKCIEKVYLPFKQSCNSVIEGPMVAGVNLNKVLGFC